MNNVVTSDFSEFGQVELEEAGRLLLNIKKIDAWPPVEVNFNKMSGFVFITDSDYRVWMMNGGEIEEFFTCPECGCEGFKDEIDCHEDNADCHEFCVSIGAVEEEDEEE
jgi:hypothetical protein